MKCQIDFNLNGTKGHAVVVAEDSIAALLQWLEGVPQSAAVKAIVRVIKPAEIAQ